MLSHEAQCDGIVAVGHDAVLCDALTLLGIEGLLRSERSLRSKVRSNDCYAASATRRLSDFCVL